jgi:hypothetical protein
MSDACGYFVQEPLTGAGLNPLANRIDIDLRSLDDHTGLTILPPFPILLPSPQQNQAHGAPLSCT